MQRHRLTDEQWGRIKHLVSEAAEQKVKTATAALLGNLNAAHASPTARAHADSMVGKVAAYRDVILAALASATNPPTTATGAPAAAPLTQEALMQTATVQLSAFANKPVTPEMVTAFHNLLGIDTSVLPSAAALAPPTATTGIPTTTGTATISAGGITTPPRNLLN
jgi:hypothetical protein